MLEKLKFAQELSDCLCGIDLTLVSKEDDSLLHLIRKHFWGSVLSVFNTTTFMRYLNEMEPNCVYLFGSNLGLHYIIIRLSNQTQYLVAGPCMFEPFSESRTRRHLRPFNLDNTLIQDFISFCRLKPVLTREKLQLLGLTLGRHILGLTDPIPFRQFEYHWNDVPPLEIMPELSTEQSNIRQVERRYEASTAMTEAIKQGNLYLAMSFLPEIRSGMPNLNRSPDPLRNLQNFCIIVNTQLRYAMEELHIHPYQLDKVSSEIGSHIEAIKSQEEASSYFAYIIRRYCDLALENNYAHLDAFSRQAVIYIKTHLSDNLTVKDTAKALSANANYLSGKFHQNVGMTFTEFVNCERTAQAAALLKRTNMQIQQIAASIGYNNTSYFTKQFVRYYGMTPREYRNDVSISS